MCRSVAPGGVSLSPSWLRACESHCSKRQAVAEWEAPARKSSARICCRMWWTSRWPRGPWAPTAATAATAATGGRAGAGPTPPSCASRGGRGASGRGKQGRQARRAPRYSPAPSRVASKTATPKISTITPRGKTFFLVHPYIKISFLHQHGNAFLYNLDIFYPNKYIHLVSQ